MRPSSGAAASFYAVNDARRLQIISIYPALYTLRAYYAIGSNTFAKLPKSFAYIVLPAAPVVLP